MLLSVSEPNYDLVLRVQMLICKSYSQYNMLGFIKKYKVLEPSEQGQGKQYTIAEIVSTYSKDNPQLTKSFVNSKNAKNQQLHINSCFQRTKQWIGNKKQTLLYIKKRQSKITLGKIPISKEKVKLKNQSNLFDQFVQTYLQIKSSYNEVMALKDAKVEVDEHMNSIGDSLQSVYYFLTIYFKNGQAWIFQFDQLQTAQLWQKLLQELIGNQKKQKEQSQNKLKQMLTQYPALSKQIEKLNQDLHNKDQQFNRQLEAERQTNRRLNSHIELRSLKMRNDEEEKLKVIENYQKQNRQLIQTHRQQLKELKDMIESQNKENLHLQAQFTKQKQNLHTKLKQLKQQKQNLSTQLKQLKQRLQTAHHTNTINQKLIATKSDQIASLTQQLTRRQNSQAQVQQQLIRRQNSQFQLQKQLKILKESHQIYFRKSEQQKRELKLNIKQLEEQAYLHIFQGNVLHKSSFEKEFLRNQVEKYTKRKIQYTKLLYRYDTLNKVNFHKYIDQHPNICIVIKLQNGMSIAGFSQDSVSQQKIASKGGFLISLTNMVSFELNEDCRSVSYDDYFLIFGNSELRIRSLQLLLFSNFAINNGYFDSRGQKYNILLGIDASRTERIHNYEIFQIIFK